MIKIKTFLCALILAGSAGVALGQEAPPAAQQGGFDASALTTEQIHNVQVAEVLFRLVGAYKQQNDDVRLTAALERLAELRPGNGDVKLALAATYAEQGEKTKTYDTLLALQKEGFGYDLTDNPNFKKVADTKVWTYAVDMLKANLKPFGEGKVAFTLPGGDHLFESLVFDSKRQRFLVGSVRDGSISIVGKDGKLTDFIKPDAANGLWSVYAMALAPDADALYVASTSSVYFKGFKQADYGKAGVFKFNLSTGKLIAKYLLAPDRDVRTLSSIAAGRDGLVFAADGIRNQIYRVDHGKLKLMVENPRLTSVRGLALSGDDKILYFADYSLGLFGVDLSAGKGFDVHFNPQLLSLAGIDGLYWYDHTLAIIQNGIVPRRVMRLSLSADGRTVTKVMPLDVANPALALPTYGTIDGDGLYFVANSQKNQYGNYGNPKDGAKLQAVQVFRSDLRFAWDKGGIDMHEVAPGKSAPGGVVSASTPGAGQFSDVQGGSESVTGN